MSRVVVDRLRVDDVDRSIRYNSVESQVGGWRHDREDDFHWTIGPSNLYFSFTGAL